jgi:hypothetical protein
LENFIVHYDKCPNMCGNYVEKYRTDVQRYPCAFIVSIYLHSHKKTRNFTFWLPLMYLDNDREKSRSSFSRLSLEAPL